MIDITNIGPEYLQVYNNYDQFSDASSDYVKGEDHVCYVVTENEVIYWIALENVWRPLNVVTTSAGDIEGVDNPVNVTLRTVPGGVIYTRVPNIPDAERIISMDNFLQNYPEIEYLDFTGNVNTVSMRSAFANSNIKDIGNVNFDKVEDITNIFENCVNFDSNHSIAIDSDVTTFTCKNCIIESNLAELTINLPNVNKGNLHIGYLDKPLNTSLIINYNDTFVYDILNVSSSADYSEQFGITTNGSECNNVVKVPVFKIGDSYQANYQYIAINALPKTLYCELFITSLNTTFNNNMSTVNATGIYNVDAKHVFFDSNSIDNCITLTKYYDIVFNNDILEDVRILNSVDIENIDYYVNCTGIRIDLNQTQLVKNDNDNNKALTHGFVYSGDESININTLNKFPEYLVYGFPYFKDLELNQLQDDYIDNSDTQKQIYCAFTERILPYSQEIQDKNKLGTHTYINIYTALLELNNIPNLTLTSNQENNTLLYEYDSKNLITTHIENNFTLNGTFNIPTKTVVNSNTYLFLGSDIVFNDVVFNIPQNIKIKICPIGENLIEENNTVFDSKYNYKFNIEERSTADPTFELQDKVIGPQISIDKLVDDSNTFTSNTLSIPNIRTTFLEAKFKDNLKIILDNRTNYINCPHYIEFYNKQNNTAENPIIIKYNNNCYFYNAVLASINPDLNVRQALVAQSEGAISLDDIAEIKLENEEQYKECINNLETIYIDCQDDGYIPLNIMGYSSKSRYYDYYVGYSRRITNIKYIYGNVTLSPNYYDVNYNNYGSYYTQSFNRNDVDGIIGHRVSKSDYDVSLLKHIDVTKALKGYWDIRFMPDLDQETVKAIVNNLEAWGGEDKLDFNLYRSQWNYLSTEEQELLNTKNYNVRITEYETDAFYTCNSSGTLQNNFQFGVGITDLFEVYVYIKSHDSSGTKIPVTMEITGISYGEGYVDYTIEESNSGYYDYRIKITGDSTSTPIIPGDGISYDATLTQIDTQKTYNFTFKIII